MYLGWVPDDGFLRPYAERAISQLDCIRPEAIDTFISIVIRLWNSDPRDYYWRREVETLTPDELVTLGIDKWARTPRMLIDCLSQKGLTAPEEAFAASVRYVRTAIHLDIEYDRCLENTLGKKRGLPFFAAVLVSTRDECCAEGKRLSGRLFGGRNLPKLPLPNCSPERCRCSYRSITKREVERKLAEGYRWA